MSKELFISDVSGRTIYGVARIAVGDNIGEWGNIVGNSIETFSAANWASYAITMTELGTTGFYEGDFPVDLFSGERAVDIIFHNQAGGSPSQGDAKLSGALYELIDEWVPTTPLDI